MKSTFSDKLSRASTILELIVGVCVLVLCLLCGIGMLVPVGPLADIGNAQYFQARLSDASYIMIGVEFIKMIVDRRIDIILDIMMLAIAREMIVHDTSPLENLTSVVSIAILFLVHKYFRSASSGFRHDKKAADKPEPPDSI